MHALTPDLGDLPSLLVGFVVHDGLTVAGRQPVEAFADEFTTSVAVPDGRVEKFFQNEIELAWGGLQSVGHTLEVLGQLIQRHRNPAGEHSGQDRICGCEGPIKVGLV